MADRKSRSGRPPPGKPKKTKVLSARIETVDTPIQSASTTLVTTSSQPQDIISVAKPQLFTLNVENSPGSPSLRFTWCLSPEATQILRNKGIFNPFLLVSIFKKHNDGLEDQLKDDSRQLLPLDRAFGIIEFSQPGNYLICASIVTAYRNPKNKGVTYRELKVLTEPNKWGEFKYCLTSNHEYKAWEATNLSFLEHHEQVTVVVSQEFFAAKPADWLWEYVNLWHERTPRDQCMFRRRAILAVPKTLAVIFYAFIVPLINLLIALILLSYGRRYLNWKALFRPTFDLETDRVKITIKAEELGINRGDIKMYWNKSSKDGKPRGELVKIIITPLNWLVLSIIPTMAAIYVKAPSLNFRLMVFFDAFTTLFMYLMIGIAISAIIDILKNLVSSPEKKARKEEESKISKELAAERKKEEERMAILRLYNERYDPLTCTTGPREASLTALPKSHRTFHLRVLDFKADVCKPFARSKR